TEPLGGRLFEEMFERNREAGNDPIDMLVCVPGTLVDRTSEEPVRCIPARQLLRRGLAVWDGTHEAGRSRPLLDHQIHRFVQYESCRGLEGWIAFLLALDGFHEQKRARLWTDNPDLAPPERDRLSRVLANEWLMIPLTRCISTLVIQLEN